MPTLTEHQTTVPGLYASAQDLLPFARPLAIRSFVLRREQGNLLVYGAPGLPPDAALTEQIGPIARQYLNHRHEASLSSTASDAPLFVHERERDAVAELLPVRGTFSRRHLLDDDFEVIPIPGHTPGATAFLWDSGEHRLLFTGDSLYLRDGEWRAAVLEGVSDRAAYVESLALLRELEFDVLVPWGADAGSSHVVMTDRDDARRRIGAVAERVWRGGDH